MSSARLPFFSSCLLLGSLAMVAGQGKNCADASFEVQGETSNFPKRGVVGLCSWWSGNDLLTCKADDAERARCLLNSKESFMKFAGKLMEMTGILRFRVFRFGTKCAYSWPTDFSWLFAGLLWTMLLSLSFVGLRWSSVAQDPLASWSTTLGGGGRTLQSGAVGLMCWGTISSWCSQASIDAERPDQMDAFGVFPPVINHARAKVDFALRRVLPTSCNVRVGSACSFITDRWQVRNKMEAHGLRRLWKSDFQRVSLIDPCFPPQPFAECWCFFLPGLAFESINTIAIAPDSVDFTDLWKDNMFFGKQPYF